LYPKWHIVTSLIIAACSLLFDQSFPILSIQLFHYEIGVFVMCLVFGVVIDADHLIDYYVSGRQAFQGENMIILLHGLENVIILLILSIIFKFPFLVFPTISYVAHMAMDIYGNGQPFFLYFYTIRFSKRL
jgi:hypothetical protein